MQNSFLIDLKYAPLLAGRIRNYKLSKPNCWKGSCPICGDSETKKHATRFYVLPNKMSNLVAYCHKCGYRASLSHFLKDNAPDLYQQYSFDLVAAVDYQPAKESVVVRKHTVSRQKRENNILSGLERISKLSHDHFAKIYVQYRQIPNLAHSMLYFTPNFASWINELDPDKERFVPKSDPRLVIPFIDQTGRVFAVQGRALANQSSRYLTHKIDADMPKIFGLDRADPNKTIKIVEGPIDSFFLTNAVAMAGSDVSTELAIQTLRTSKDRIVKVLDNEPRSIHIIRRLEDNIKDGLNVCIWPSDIKSKDLNAMATDEHYSPAELDILVNKHTYSGLQAELQLSLWRKT
jgi:hypothetical protein